MIKTNRQSIQTYPSSTRMISSIYMDEIERQNFRKQPRQENKKFVSLAQSGFFNQLDKKSSVQVHFDTSKNAISSQAINQIQKNKQINPQIQASQQLPYPSSIQSDNRGYNPLTQSLPIPQSQPASQVQPQNPSTCPKCLQPTHQGKCDNRILLKKINTEGMAWCSHCKNIYQHENGRDVIACSCGHSFCTKCFGLRVLELDHQCMAYNFTIKNKKIDKLRKLASQIQQSSTKNSTNSNPQKQSSQSQTQSQSQQNLKQSKKTPALVPVPVPVPAPTPAPTRVYQFCQSSSRYYPTQILNLIARCGGQLHQKSTALQYLLVYALIALLYVPMLILYTLLVVLYVLLVPIGVSFVGGFLKVRNACKRAGDGLSFCYSMFCGFPMIIICACGTSFVQIFILKFKQFVKDVDLLLHFKKPTFMKDSLANL